MGRGIGYGFTAAQRQELWDRYQRGESLKAIALVFAADARAESSF